ncbi:MAG: cobalamin biosynthesis protein CobD [Oscillospiraceae bacterium]|nr:cobalamin biosynthesis protein CobD [Oscillospiraceae bacterium]
MKILYCALPLLIGFGIDCILGDPHSLPHPIRAIGALIAKLEGFIRSHFHSLKTGGIFLAAAVLLVSSGLPLVILLICYRLHPAVGILAESLMCYYLMAPRCLKTESMKVCRALEAKDMDAAKTAVSMIVGRDTHSLSEPEIIRAAVETVAENTSDGVTAPILYMIFGAPLGFFYKAANTMDSMIGYRNERYAELGYFAAKLDDVLNFIPSRISAIVMIATTALLRMDARRAFRIWRRDRRRHASPNSAQTEAVCAGALGIRLGGNAYYFGTLHQKDWIGDPTRPPETDDIRRANRLMYGTSVIVLLISAAVRSILFGGVLF